MDLSHDIMKQIGEDIQIRRNREALLAELTGAHAVWHSEGWSTISPHFYEYFASEEWIDWFYAPGDRCLVEQREHCGTLTFCEDGRQHTECPDDDGRLHDSANLCSWEEAVQLREQGELPIVE